MPTIDHSIPLKNYYVLDAGIYDDSRNITPIAGIPEYYTNEFGNYSGYYPYIAAQKAVTGIYRHMKKYPDWFPEYDPDNAPPLVLVLVRKEDGKKFAYNGWREPAPQSKGKTQGRMVQSSDTRRTRSYKWISKVKKISLEDVGYGE